MLHFRCVFRIPAFLAILIGTIFVVSLPALAGDSGSKAYSNALPQSIGGELVPRASVVDNGVKRYLNIALFTRPPDGEFASSDPGLEHLPLKYHPGVLVTANIHSRTREGSENGHDGVLYHVSGVHYGPLDGQVHPTWHLQSRRITLVPPHQDLRGVVFLGEVKNYITDSTLHSIIRDAFFQFKDGMPWPPIWTVFTELVEKKITIQELPSIPDTEWWQTMQRWTHCIENAPQAITVPTCDVEGNDDTGP